MPALITASVLTGLSVAATVESTQEQRRAARLQRRIASIKARRERAQLLRQQRVARAQAEQSAISSGTGQTSGLSGQLAGIAQTTASNVSFLDQTQALGNAANRAQTRAATAGAYANIFGAGAQTAIAFRNT